MSPKSGGTSPLTYFLQILFDGDKFNFCPLEFDNFWVNVLTPVDFPSRLSKRLSKKEGSTMGSKYILHSIVLDNLDWPKV